MTTPTTTTNALLNSIRTTPTSTSTESVNPILTIKTVSEARMRQEAMDVVVAKIISMLILTVLSVLSGLLPLRLLLHAPNLFTRGRQPTDYFLCGLRLFSGGIYLATCFLHLLPDTREKIAAVMVNMGSRTTYAVPELLIISGFYAVVFVEQIIKALYMRAQRTDTNRKRKPRRASKPRESRRPTVRSHLDEETFQCSHFRMEDDCRDTRTKYTSESNGDDDDDDDDNVLVEEEDDDISFDDSDSDQHSDGSYTCVKQSFNDQQETDFDDSTLPHNRILSNTPGLKSLSYSDALKNCPVDTEDSKQLSDTTSTTTNQVDHDAKAATVPVSVTSVSSSVVFKTPPASVQADNGLVMSSIIATNPAPLKSSFMRPAPGADESHHKSNSHNNALTFPVHSTSQDKLQHPLGHYFHQPPLKPQSQTDATTQRSAPEIIEADKDHRNSFNQATDETCNHLIRSSQHIHPPHDKSSSSCNHNPNPYPTLAKESDVTKEVTQDKLDENSVRREGVSMETDRVEFNLVRDRDRDSGIFSTKRDCEDYVGETLPLKQLSSNEASIDRISERSYSLQDIQVKHVVDELKREDLTKDAHFRSIIYIMALSFHGIFEGMALGLQSMKSSVWALCFAIVVHRCVLAFKLGMDLCRGEEKQGTSFLCIGTFTLISTLGIIVGILISSGASLYSDVTVPEAILQSLATGTIFYIVFLDILFKDLQGRDDLKRVSCFFVGFSLMAIVFAVTRS